VKKIIFAVALVVASLYVGGTFPEDSPGKRSDPLFDTVVWAPSDLLAAFLVAYDANSERWHHQGIQFTPRDLIARHYAVRISRDGKDRVRVSFGPASPDVAGGGVTYFVDTERLKVVERMFER